MLWNEQKLATGVGRGLWGGAGGGHCDVTGVLLRDDPPGSYGKGRCKVRPSKGRVGATESVGGNNTDPVCPKSSESSPLLWETWPAHKPVKLG